MRVRAAFIAGLAALAVGDTAHAATWNVVGTGDGGTCDEKTQVCPSLRAAIAASEATKEEPDTINVPPGVININNDLVIQSDITINGSSARTTIIDGGFKYRGFRVTSSGNAKINHLTVRNGAANQGNSVDGGGILNQSGVVQLNTVRVTGSQAEGRGGGIANHQGTLTLVNGLVDNNTAGDGGGISNFGGAESPDRGLLGVATTTIFKNTAGIGGAGGISSRGGQLNVVLLNTSTVADNAGGVRGVGGLLIQSGAAQIVGDLFARNTVAGEGIVNCAPMPVDGGGNLEDETDCIDAGGNANPDLATALRSEGGELDVLPLGEKSQAIDRNSVLCSAPDARGLGRPQGPACDSGAYEVDQAPRVTITAGPSGTVATPDVQFEFESTEPSVTYQCQLTGPGRTPGFTACKSPQSYTGLANGAYTFSVRALDGQFADPPVETRTFTVAALDTTITAGPPNPTNDTTPTFSFIGVNGAIGFQCRVDGGVFTTCTSPHTTAALSPGTHTFEVRALSVSGAPDPTPASQTFVIDTTAPDTTITSGPTGSVSSTTAAFTFSSTEAGSTFQCSLDGAPFGACPLNYTGLSQGQHTFAVRATDAAGNTDGSPATRTWTVDTTAPNPPVITTPADNALLISGTIAFVGTAEPGVTVQLREGTTLEGSAIASGTGSWTIVLAAVSDGTHTYTARAIDAANNTSGPTNRTVTVDSTMPETTITGGPNGLTNDDTPTFTFSSEANATFECALDGAAHTPCPNPFTTSPLSQGAHTLSVRAVDLAGNRDNTPATRNFTVDSIAPNTTITGGPTGAVSSTTATFTFTSTEAQSTFQCSLDGAAFGTCPTSYTGLSQGPHTFAVQATDPAGNTDPSPATRTWTVDTQAPAAPVIISPAQGELLGSSTVTLTGTAEAGSTVVVREGTTVRGSATATGGNWTVNVAGAADGVHTYSVTARDAAGNESAPATRAVTIDTGPPPPPAITAGPSGPINTTTAQFSFTGEPGATFECVIDDEDPVNCASPHTYQNLSEGDHVFGVRQIDAAGNGGDPTARGFTVDLTPPAPPTVVSGPAGETTEQSPAFAFTSEAGTRVECRLDGPAGPGAFAACTSPHSFSGLAPGAYTFVIRSSDAAGNQRTTSRSFTVTAVQAAQIPTPTPTPSPTPTATPTPVPNQSVVVGPSRGRVLVKVKGSNRFEELDETQGIPVGSEVDARKGRVTLTAVPRRGRPPETAEFYDGMFIVTQKGGITDLKLSEPLDCSSKRARASAKKAKKRRLWGKGSGRFRTTGRYSAATVRGTTWLVQDTCTTTLTRVTQGVVAVRDKVKRKTVLVKKGKRYTARKRR